MWTLTFPPPAYGPRQKGGSGTAVWGTCVKNQNKNMTKRLIGERRDARRSRGGWGARNFTKVNEVQAKSEYLVEKPGNKTNNGLELNTMNCERKLSLSINLI